MTHFHFSISLFFALFAVSQSLPAEPIAAVELPAPPAPPQTTGSVTDSLVTIEVSPAPEPIRAPAPEKPAAKQSSVQKATREPFRLIVPSIHLDIPVAHGIDDAALRKAPGHDPLSALPGQQGNCVIASHRNIHGAYFWYLPKVTPKSQIMLQTPRELLVYKVVYAGLVPETKTDWIENGKSDEATHRLTLYTCTLPVSKNRYVVVAHLMSRSAASPTNMNRPTLVREITSGPLHLLKDKALRARAEARLRALKKKSNATVLSKAPNVKPN